MNKVCVGCGSVLQSIDESMEGYVSSKVIDRVNMCKRCFKLKNYGEVYNLDNSIDKDKLINEVNSSNKSVLYLVDTLTISNDVLKFIDSITNKVYLVLTKRDLLPKSVVDSKLIEYVKEKTLIKDVFVISSYNGYGIDTLYKELIRNKESSVYVVGYTSSGKSTFINKLLSLNGFESNILESCLPNTTLETINIRVNDKLEVIDTPGLTSDRALFNYIDINEYKKLIPKNRIKPKVYSLKSEFMILLGNILRIENNSGKDVNLVFYFKNEIKLSKMRSIRNTLLKDKDMISLSLNNEDIVVEGAGFIKVVGACDLRIYAVNNKCVSKRDKLI